MLCERVFLKDDGEKVGETPLFFGSCGIMSP